MSNLLFTTTFSGSPTTADSRPGSTTGVGADWQDWSPGQYSLSSGLVSTGTGVGALLRPAWETTASSIVEAVFKLGTYPPAYFELYARWSPTASAGYCLLYINGDLALQRRGVGVSRGPSNAASHYYPYVTGSNYVFRLWITPSSVGRSTVVATMALASAPTTYLAACILPDDDMDQGQNRGQVGLAIASGGQIVSFSHYDLAGDALPSIALPLSASPIRFIRSNATTITLASGTPAGGTGSLSLQWHRDVTANFTPTSGNALSGQTSAQLIDSPPLSATPYAYKLQVTDGASNVQTTNELIAATDGAALTVGIVSDSTFVIVPPDGTRDAGTALGNALTHFNIAQTVNVINRGSGGTVTGDWVSGSSAAIAAQTAFAASPPDVIVIHLGVNDAQNNVAATTFGANLANIVQWCLASGSRVIIDTPQFVEQNNGNIFSSAANELILQYLGWIKSLVDNRRVFAGADTFGMTRRDPYSRLDGLHFNANGVERFADVVADAIGVAMLPPGTITATFGHFRSHSGALAMGTFNI
ncbi:MAG: SGNH/GDSL hydrolase family protein [Phycisphaerae bacterium]|nr:SGNH/GDSL hydrolase family protein [Phycisphaerae bacterium]